MARLFLALWPDDSVRNALAQWRDGWQWPRSATPVRTERLHLTLHFLGEVDDGRKAALLAAMAVSFAPFELALGRNALWPHGIAVLEPLAIPPALLALQADLGAVLTGLGVTLDARAYRPHVTLARRAAGASAVQEGPALTWQVDRYALLESADGYRELAVCAAAPAAGVKN